MNGDGMDFAEDERAPASRQSQTSMSTNTTLLSKVIVNQETYKSQQNVQLLLVFGRGLIRVGGAHLLAAAQDVARTGNAAGASSARRLQQRLQFPLHLSNVCTHNLVECGTTTKELKCGHGTDAARTGHAWKLVRVDSAKSDIGIP